VRVYHRTLTDDELAHNRKIDEARFKGRMPGLSVVVTTRHGGDGEELGEAAGYYRVEGEYTFTAQRVNSDKGVPKTVSGCWVEELVDGVWTNKKWHSGKSFTYSESSGKTYRITWCSGTGLKVFLS
jgi:hypothetical protein